MTSAAAAAAATPVAAAKAKHAKQLEAMIPKLPLHVRPLPDFHIQERLLPPACTVSARSPPPGAACMPMRAGAGW